MSTKHHVVWLRAEVLALSAALTNGMIGPLNRIAFAAGGTPQQIAFFKCFGAFALLLGYCLAHRPHRAALTGLVPRAGALLFLSLTGVAGLYLLESWAFFLAPIPVVSFSMYAAGGLVIPLSAALLKERVRARQIVVFGLILIGIWLIGSGGDFAAGSFAGIVLALLAGLAYTLFLVTAKLLHVGSGLGRLVWMFGASSLVLVWPWWLAGAVLPGPVVAATILVQVLVPAIGGYWLTLHAVHKGSSTSTVQAIETSEPLFASLYAFALFGDRLSPTAMVGAVLILGGLMLSLLRERHPIVLPRPASKRL
jgi:drug/metabolite transporter (DMT)-like permease